jgi:VIT1/CCC1 family predicted Fe2+/Mn2+ transporter
MINHTHDEKHFNASDTLRDMVIGMSDGLTVPFALAAGLSRAVANNQLIVTAGLAEIAAGAIAMGLGGYLAARTEVHHFDSERRREEKETEDIPEVEAEEVASLFRSYDLDDKTVATLVDAIRSDKQRWVDFMMKFELGLERPDSGRALKSALTIGIAYIVGGLIPLSPYFFSTVPTIGLQMSILVTLISLFIFGYVKGKFTVATPWRSAFQTLAIGAVAASAAYGIARLFG